MKRRKFIGSLAGAASLVAVGLTASDKAAAQSDASSKRIVSILDFGAVADGNSATPTDNLVYFSNAIQALSVLGGGVLIIPPGTFYCSGQIVIVDTNISIEGSGSNQSFILFGSNATSGLVFQLPNSGAGTIFQSAHVKAITLLTNNASLGGSSASPGKCAISYLPSQPQQGSPYITAVIEDVEIRGNNGYVNFWDTGIYLNNVVNAWIESVEVLGCFNKQLMYQGILADDYAVNVTCSSCICNYAYYGYRMYSNEPTVLPPGAQVSGTEGLQVINSGVYGCAIGACHDNGTNPDPRPALQVVGCNFNCTYTCASTSNVTESCISGNIFYIQDTAYVNVQAGAACINLANPNNSASVFRHVVSGNILRSLASTSIVRGVVCSCQYAAISGNVFDTFDYGIILTPASSSCVVSGSVFRNIMSFQIQNAGTKNTFSALTALAQGVSVNIQ